MEIVDSVNTGGNGTPILAESHPNGIGIPLTHQILPLLTPQCLLSGDGFTFTGHKNQPTGATNF